MFVELLDRKLGTHKKGGLLDRKEVSFSPHTGSTNILSPGYGLTTTGFTVLGGVLLSVLTLATLPGNRRSGQQYDRLSGKQGTRRYGDQANRLDQGHVQYYPGFTGRV